MTATVIRGDARHLPLPDASVDLIVTSPPYFGLRSYTDGGEHMAGQIGSEATPGEWLAALVECTAEWVRVLKPEGSLFVNLGDKYATRYSSQRGGGRAGLNGDDDSRGRSGQNHTGAGEKSLLGLPWRYALAATDQLGLIFRRDIIWSKPNGLPESVTDRCRSSHEYVFHLVKQPRYFSAVDEIREPQAFSGGGDMAFRRAVSSNGGGNHRDFGSAKADYNPLGKLPGSVWTIASQPLTVPPALGVDHFAAFPMELPRRIISGWSPAGVCTGCGQGRRPVTAKPGLLGGDNNTERLINGRYFASGFNGGQKNWAQRMERPDYISGYACACTDLPRLAETAHAVPPQPGQPPTRPAVVLDPFGGTGTTALVAHALGRHGISVDLSADYCRLAAWRLHDPGERARALEVPKPPPVHEDQIPMFDLAR